MRFLTELLFTKGSNLFDVLAISTLVSMKDLSFLEITVWCFIGATISIYGSNILKKMKEKDDERGT